MNLTRKKLYSILRPLFFSLSVLPYTSSWAAHLSAQLDRYITQEGEPVTLVVSVDGMAANNPPDFQALTSNFEILASNTASEYDSINGQVSQQTKWTLRLLPKRAGSLEIPSLTLDNEHTAAMTLNVTSAGAASAHSSLPGNANKTALHANGPVFLRARVSNSTAYVNSPIIYTVSLYSAIALAGGTLSAPGISNASLTPLASGDVHKQIQMDGKPYQVLEKKFLLTPTQAGSISIDGPRFVGETIPTDPFLDPFNDEQPQGPIARVAPSVRLQVKPIPAAWNMQNSWLPARSLKISERWSGNPQKMLAGQALTRTVVIDADGAAATQIPSLDLNLDPSVNVYANHPTVKTTVRGDHVLTHWECEYAIIPSDVGDLNVPAVELPWWSSTSNSLQKAIIPAKLLQVRALKNSGAASSGSAMAALQKAKSNPAATQGSSPEKMSDANAPKVHGPFWLFTSLILGCGWLLSLLVFWTLRKRSAKNKKASQKPSKDAAFKASQGNALGSQNASALLKQLRKACVDQNPKAAHDALLAWAQLYWPLQTVHNLQNVAELFADSAFTEEVTLLSRCLYGREGAVWQGERLWTVLKETLKHQKNPALGVIDVLPPLYPE